MCQIHAVAALKSNYIWFIQSAFNNHVIIVDPGEAKPALEFIENKQFQPVAIINTHQHYDHIDGIKELVDMYQIPVYGSALELVPALTHPIQDHSQIKISEHFPTFNILNIPGHTAGHIAYQFEDKLFCGDTIFGAGCGRLLGGTADQLYSSILQLTQLPAETQLYCSHEYTEANLEFALLIEPNNPAILKRKNTVKALRDKGLPTLPSTLELELATNPFLRCDNSAVKASAEQYAGYPLNHAVDVFRVLRLWKDRI
jgi:hydroxyacylglutathione hydrolase